MKARAADKAKIADDLRNAEMVIAAPTAPGGGTTRRVSTATLLKGAADAKVAEARASKAEAIAQCVVSYSNLLQVVMPPPLGGSTPPLISLRRFRRSCLSMWS